MGWAHEAVPNIPYWLRHLGSHHNGIFDRSNYIFMGNVNSSEARINVEEKKPSKPIGRPAILVNPRRVNFVIPEEELSQLEIMAADKGMSRSAFLTWLIQQRYKIHKRK
jgi:hypothetical protein